MTDRWIHGWKTEGWINRPMDEYITSRTGESKLTTRNGCFRFLSNTFLSDIMCFT